MHSKTNLLTLHCGEEKYRVDCKATNMEPSKENGQLGLKRPEHPSGSQGSVFSRLCEEEGLRVQDQLTLNFLIG